MNKLILLPCLLFLFVFPALSQTSLLNKKVSVSVVGKKPVDVLQQLSRDGGFYFSYDSKLVNNDTLVTLQLRDVTVREALDKIFGNALEYKESDGYIILRKCLPVAASSPVNTTYIIRGRVVDGSTGLGIANTSVYEKTRLVSTLTNDDGTFVLKLKTRSLKPLLNFSRQDYVDTNVAVSLPFNSTLLVSLQSLRVPVADTNTITVLSPTDTHPVIIPDSVFAFAKTPVLTFDTNRLVERTRSGKFLLTTKQKIQSLNLSRFYTTRVYQLSLTPGLSTHGRLSPQVENSLSLNAIGGYTGGIRAFEAGGVFNITRRDVRYVQVAGVFNIVGGNVNGIQAAGIYNHVLGNVDGAQAAGVSNAVNGVVKGAQLAGVYNCVNNSMKGWQAAGVANVVKRQVGGLQIAGVGNVAAQTMSGVQIAGVFNYAKKLNGIQIGLVNIADSSGGFSIGLINIVKHGYHQIALSANEFSNANLAIKTGNRKLYSLLMTGYNFSNNHKLFTYGYGIGTSLKLAAGLRLQPEITSQYLYTGDWSFSNILNSFHLNLQQKVAKNVSLFIAPVCRVYISHQHEGITDYRYPVTPSSLSFNMGRNVNGWIGFSAGIALL